MPTYPDPVSRSAGVLSPEPALDSRAAVRRQARRSSWLKTLHQWHWISSALCLLGMLLFAITGITLNHAADIGSTPVVETRTGILPEPLLMRLLGAAPGDEDRSESPLPQDTRAWLRAELGVQASAEAAEWSEDEVYLAMPRPGGDAWLRIGLADGAVEYEHTDRGWISYLNDLHKGRHTGAAWSWFLDVFSAACIVFSLTGLFILQMHAANRPMVWPTVGLGVVIPVLLAILFVH